MTSPPATESPITLRKPLLRGSLVALAALLSVVLTIGALAIAAIVQRAGAGRPAPPIETEANDASAPLPYDGLELLMTSAGLGLLLFGALCVYLVARLFAKAGHHRLDAPKEQSQVDFAPDMGSASSMPK